MIMQMFQINFVHCTQLFRDNSLDFSECLNETTNVTTSRILSFSLLGANMMKMEKYMASIAAPMTLMVDIKMLFGDTYQYLFEFLQMFDQNNHMFSKKQD